MKPLTFLWLAGIRGDSQDPRHIGDFNVLSYKWGTDKGSDVWRLGAGVGTGVKAQVVDLNFEIKDETWGYHQIFWAWGKTQFIHTAILTCEKNMGGRSAGLLIRFVMRDTYLVSMKRSDGTLESPSNSHIININFKSLDIYKPS